MKESSQQSSTEKNDRDKAENRKALKRVGPRVLGLAQGYWKTLIVGFIALSLGSGINLLFPYLIRKVLNQELGFVLARDLGWITVVMIVLFGIQAFFFYVRHYAFTAVGYRVVSEVRQLLYLAIMSQDIAFFDRSRVGDLLSRLSSDAQLVQRAVTINISVALRYLLQVAGGIVLMLIISPRLTLLIILLIPLLVVCAAVWGKQLRGLSKSMQEHLAEANVVAEETVGAVRTVRVFAGNNYEAGRYNHAIGASLTAGLDRTKVAAAFSSTMVFLLNAAIAIVVYYGGTRVLSGQMSMGDLTGFLLYCVIVAVSFGFLVNVYEEFMQAVGAAERIFEIMDSVPEVVSPEAPKRLPAHEKASVRFDRVHFSYPSRPDIPVLTDVSFEIPPGKTVAIVGPSGSGKSTIASLIPRFYDPLSGTISYCSTPLRELSLEELRGDISIVAQQPQVFSISIGENIRYGRLNATEAEVVEAAKAAHIHDFIESLPEKYATLVGDRGIQLSGGERQRVAIARAILKNPRFLILDEATSALDSENEALVQDALNNLMVNRTTLVIAHRLSTVQHADRVLVLKDGAVIQEGTHLELFNQSGLYRTLVEHQLLV
ncbi:MAG: ABC transporter transmembrane domain-containing protein [Bdellovibrionota bacterium]